MNNKNLPTEKPDPQPIYVLSPESFEGQFQSEEIDLGRYVLVLWRRKVLILAITILAGVLTFFVSQVWPKKYQATASLLVQPPRFSTELRPEPLSVEAYQSIVESGNVILALRNRLVESGNIAPNEPTGNLRTELQSSRDRNQVYRPIIDLVVTNRSPEKAALIADTWAQIAVDEVSNLTIRGKQSSLDLIQTEYPIAKNRLEEFESQLKIQQDKYDNKILNKENYWSQRISDFKREWNISSLKEQQIALNTRLTEVMVELNDIRLQIKDSQETLKQLKLEIEKHPQFIVVSKAINDDALWEQIGRDFSGNASEELAKLKLRSEMINPVYSSLIQRLADQQVLYETQVPREQFLQDQVASLQEESRQLNSKIIEKETELEDLVRTRDNELKLLQREMDFVVGKLKREVSTSQKAFETLSEKYEESRLANSEVVPDVSISSRALTPDVPSSPRPLLNTALGIVLGGFFSVIAVFVLEFIENSKDIQTVRSSSKSYSVTRNSG
jgi:uncharacterized protein involved in exopolysaccharide biosynthesis